MAIQYLDPNDPYSTPVARDPKKALAQQFVNPTLPGGYQAPPEATTGQGIDERVGSSAQQSSNQQPAVTQANQMAQAPYFQPQAPGSPVAQFPPGGGAYGMAYNLAGQLANRAQLNPEVISGRKETAKERYLHMMNQANEQTKQSEASRGLGGGWASGQIAENTANAPLDLTNIYRGIESDAESQGLANLIAALQATQGLAGLDLQGELGRGRLALEGELGRGQLGIAQGQLGLGGRSQDLAEANAVWERNNIIPILAAILGPSFNWGT